MEDTGGTTKADVGLEKPSRSSWARVVRCLKRRAHKRRVKERKESPADRAARRTANATIWMAISTVILAAISGGTLLILNNQLREMHEGGIDTHALADATGKMKDSAEKSAQASRDFADTAANISTEVGDAVEKLDAQAKAIEESRKSSEAASSKTLNTDIEASKLDERAWIGFVGVQALDFSEEKGLPVMIEFLNSGKTPARNVQLAPGYRLSHLPLPGPTPQDIRDLAGRFESVQSIPPQGKFNQALGLRIASGEIANIGQLRGNQDIIDNFQNIKNKFLTLYYFGELKYEDVSGRSRVSSYCVFLADPDKGTWGICPQFNDLQ